MEFVGTPTEGGEVMELNMTGFSDEELEQHLADEDPVWTWFSLASDVTIWTDDQMTTSNITLSHGSTFTVTYASGVFTLDED